LSRDNQVIGGFVCKYGWHSGYTCGYISSKWFSSAYPNNTATFIRVNNTAGFSNLSDGGDSGGPWFNGNTADGIHHAEPSDDPNDAIYMAINYINDLGVSVVEHPALRMFLGTTGLGRISSVYTIQASRLVVAPTH
jgi:hypothetical protein